jgi:type I restriction enzyme S subunit
MSALTFDRYDEYKDSGVEWLGEVPSTWALGRHKDNFCFITYRCTDSSFLKVGLENIEGKTGRFISTDSEFDGDGIEFKKNDILFGKLRPYLAKVYQAEFSGNAVGDIFVYRSKRDVEPNFASYLMLSDRYIDVMNSSTVGAKMPRVSSGFIANLPLSLPPRLEQTAIANYLDEKTEQIDRKIDLLSKKATQYGKLKQSLINETVTRGLDKSVPMKDSGVEWIGEVPEAWETCRLKEVGHLYSGLTGKSGDDFTKENEYVAPFVPFTNIANNFYLSTSNLKPVVVYPGEKQNFVKKHDLFFLMSSEGYEYLGKCSLLVDEMERTTYLNSFCKGFRFTKEIVNPVYVNYLLHSTQYRIALSNEGKGFTRINLRMDKIKDIKLLIPSSFEQTAIADYLDEKTAKIDNIVDTINRQIDKLKEFRKALINDVVTGGIKV